MVVIIVYMRLSARSEEGKINGWDGGITCRTKKKSLKKKNIEVQPSYQEKINLVDETHTKRTSVRRKINTTKKLV